MYSSISLSYHSSGVVAPPSLTALAVAVYKLPLKHGSADDEHPLLLSPHPLHNLHRPLRQRLPTRIRRRNTVQLKQRRTPRQRNTTNTRFVMDLQARRLRVQRRVQVRVQAR